MTEVINPIDPEIKRTIASKTARLWLFEKMRDGNLDTSEASAYYLMHVSDMLPANRLADVTRSDTWALDKEADRILSLDYRSALNFEDGVWVQGAMAAQIWDFKLELSESGQPKPHLLNLDDLIALEQRELTELNATIVKQ